ncbi:aldo/keto reductase [Euzebyella saccharophila]|uniref:Aldo/keto reductase family oxidoreductase n=1 Tax=Euzebyella saccharophila TaxID=679664 RepID=A0ABV8JS65_9FLAO|nr:aldo/keto reductase [Euzebyella saccharophila]
MQNNIFYSKIIAGTMTWGSWGKQFSTQGMNAVLNHCFELGITTFDHADIYGDYTNEEQFGKALAISGIARTQLQLISKCGIQMSGSRKNKVKHYEYSKEYIIWSVERSLGKLQTEYLDLLLLHRPSPLLEPEEVAAAVAQLKTQGKIMQFGVSNFNPGQIAMLETAVAVEANQIEFSLTQNGALLDGSLDDCKANSRMAMSWSPLGSYFKKSTDVTLRIKKCLADFTKKYNATEDQLLLAWVLKHPANVSPVVGTATLSRLALALGATEINLELQDWFLLLEAANGQEVP